MIHLVKNFIALGLASNEEIGVSFFRNLVSSGHLSKEDVLQEEISVDKFLSLFKSQDEVPRRILKVLNAAVKEKLKNS